jgi:N5-(carboxyethyl)ornithine synthase
MKTMGFVIARKDNERRRALIPPDIGSIKNARHLFFEEGYGDIVGYGDEDYRKTGARVVRREDAYRQDIICTAKVPEPAERKLLRAGQTLFGWIHAVQGKQITDFLLKMKMTAIAWEEMFENGRYVFRRNRELAGEAGVLHAFLYYGKAPYECSVAVIGRGNTARGAIRVLEKMGAKVTVYNRETSPSLRKELGEYDVIVNCVLWDVLRKDRLIYREDLGKMRRGAMIIDISCDKELEIETSHPTTIDKPIYYVDGVLHYAVDNIPSIFWKTATASISEQIKKYIDDLVEENDNEVLRNATVIKEGRVIDEKIMKFQKQRKVNPRKPLRRRG